jgi:hypothetical protein
MGEEREEGEWLVLKHCPKDFDVEGIAQLDGYCYHSLITQLDG